MFKLHEDDMKFYLDCLFIILLSRFKILRSSQGSEIFVQRCNFIFFVNRAFLRHF